VIAKHSVEIGYIHPGNVTWAFHVSMMNILPYEMLNRDRSRLRGTLSEFGCVLAAQRNEVTWGFIKRARAADIEEAPPIEWLLFIDTDIGFPADLLDKFAEVADPIERPIVSGMYFSFPRDNYYLPIWIEERNGKQEWVLDPLSGPEPRPLIACGMGCCLIHRSVLEKVLEQHKDDDWPWFGHDRAPDGKRLGEDTTFCQRAREAGFPIFGTRSIELGHMKTREYTKEQFREPEPAQMSDLSEAQGAIGYVG